MKKISYTTLFILVIFCSVGFGPFSFLLNRTVQVPVNKKGWVDQEIKRVHTQAENLDLDVLKMSLVAYLSAQKKGLPTKQLLTIIDYSKPSSERRLWVIDLKNAKVLFNTWVSHGRNSGKIFATSFSNEKGSLKSSLGVFLTSKAPYNGSNGYSLRLVGLESGINDKALQRDIVFHGAWYAHPNVIKKYGFLGRSWGCPAVSVETAKPLINTIKGKSLVFVYYPYRKWLNHSTFLASGRTEPV